MSRHDLHTQELALQTNSMDQVTVTEGILPRIPVQHDWTLGRQRFRQLANLLQSASRHRQREQSQACMHAREYSISIRGTTPMSAFIPRRPLWST
jgi:hypothetical protein